MDVDYLHAFCQLAEHKNYRIAAEHLHITQSALTKKIQRLEGKVGGVLFERGRQGALLTPAGRALCGEARRLLKAFSSFEDLSKAVINGTEGHLNIGFGISTFQCAPQFIADFKQCYPNVHITLNDMPSQHQLDCLHSGELHISFNRLPVEPPLKYFPLFSEQLVVAIHKDERIDKNQLWEVLKQLPYLSLNPKRGPGLDKQIRQWLLAEKVDLLAVQVADDILTLLALVSARLGFAILPASAKNINQPQINFIPLQGAFSNWEIGVVWNEDFSDPLRERFITQLKNKKGVNDSFYAMVKER